MNDGITADSNSWSQLFPSERGAAGSHGLPEPRKSFWLSSSFWRWNHRTFIIWKATRMVRIISEPCSESSSSLSSSSTASLPWRCGRLRRLTSSWSRYWQPCWQWPRPLRGAGDISTTPSTRTTTRVPKRHKLLYLLPSYQFPHTRTTTTTTTTTRVLPPMEGRYWWWYTISDDFKASFLLHWAKYSSIEYEDYYPTLFRHDHRDFFVNVDHRYIYCDCRFFSNILTMRYVQYVQ